MSRAHDFTGQWFGDVEVLRRTASTQDGKALWHCWCHRCGRPWTMRAQTLAAAHRPGRSVNSCGCARGGAGEANHQARLTWTKVRSLRALWHAGGTTKSALGRRFLVSRRLVGMILRGEIWHETSNHDF